jgi:cbb3-type cytochrome oxidase subunit 3
MGRLAKELEWYEVGVAIIAILYGVFKIALGLIAIFLPDSYRRKHPILREILSDDTTVAAKVMEIVLIIFGVYSLLTALDMLGYIYLPWLTSRQFIYSFYTTLGMVLILFYYLVVYTRVHIQKDNSEMFRYKFIGIAGGIGFLIMVPLFFIYHQWEDHGLHLNASWEQRIQTVLAILFTIFLACAIVFMSLEAKKQNVPSNTTLMTLQSITPKAA